MLLPWAMCKVLCFPQFNDHIYERISCVLNLAMIGLVCIRLRVIPKTKTACGTLFRNSGIYVFSVPRVRVSQPVSPEFRTFKWPENFLFQFRIASSGSWILNSDLQYGIWWTCHYANYFRRRRHSVVKMCEKQTTWEISHTGRSLSGKINEIIYRIRRWKSDRTTLKWELLERILYPQWYLQNPRSEEKTTTPFKYFFSALNFILDLYTFPNNPRYHQMN